MKLEAKQKFFFALGASVVVLVTVVLLVIVPLFRSLDRLSGEFIETKKELFRLEKAKNQLGELERQYGENSRHFAEIEEVFFRPEKDDLEFILLIEQIAKETGNVHTLASPVYSSAEQLNRYFSSALTLKGTFPDLLRFLERFHAMKFYGDIDSIMIRKTVEVSPGASPFIETQLSFKVYTL